MKKYLLFGMLAAILAGALVLAGCEGAATPSVTNNYYPETGKPGLGDEDTLYEQALPTDGFVVVSTVDEAELALNIAPIVGTERITSVVLMGDNELTRMLTIPSGKALYVGYAAQGKAAGKLTVKSTGSITLEDGYTNVVDYITGLYAAGLAGSRTGAVILESGATITTGPGSGTIGDSLTSVFLFNRDNPNATFVTGSNLTLGVKGVTNVVGGEQIIAAYGTKAEYDLAPSEAAHVIYGGTAEIASSDDIVDLIVEESDVIVTTASGSIEVLKGNVKITDATGAAINIYKGGLTVNGSADSSGEVNVYEGDVLVEAGAIADLHVYEGKLDIIDDSPGDVTAVTTTTVDKKDVIINVSTINADITATLGNILVEGDITSASLTAGGNVVLCDGSITGDASGAKILVNGGDAVHATFFTTNPTVTKGISLVEAVVVDSTITAGPDTNVASIATDQNTNAGSIKVGALSKVGTIELTAGTYSTTVAAVTLTGGDTFLITFADTSELTLTGAAASIKAGNTTLKGEGTFIDGTSGDSTISGAGEVAIGTSLSLSTNVVLQTTLKDDTTTTGTNVVPPGLTTTELAKILGTGTVLLDNPISSQAYSVGNNNRVGAITTGGGTITLSVPKGVTVYPGATTIAMGNNTLKVNAFEFTGTLTATTDEATINDAANTVITVKSVGGTSAVLAVPGTLKGPGVTFTGATITAGDVANQSVTITANPTADNGTTTVVTSNGAGSTFSKVVTTGLTLGNVTGVGGTYTFKRGHVAGTPGHRDPTPDDELGGGTAVGTTTAVGNNGSLFEIDGPATITAAVTIAADGTLDIKSGAITNASSLITVNGLFSVAGSATFTAGTVTTAGDGSITVNNVTDFKANAETLADLHTDAGVVQPAWFSLSSAMEATFPAGATAKLVTGNWGGAGLAYAPAPGQITLTGATITGAAGATVAISSSDLELTITTASSLSGSAVGAYINLPSANVSTNSAKLWKVADPITVTLLGSVS